MKNFITIILVLVSTVTFSQRKVETTYLRVKSLKNAELVRVDEKGRFKKTSIKDLNLAVPTDNSELSNGAGYLTSETVNLPTDNSQLSNGAGYITENQLKNYKAGTNITIDNSNPNAPVINASGGGFPSLDDVLTVGNTSEKSLKISSSSSRYSLLSPSNLSIYNGSTNARYFATSTVMKSGFGESVLRADYLQVEDANDNIAKLGGNNILFRKDNFSGVNLKAGDVTGSNKTVYLPSENGTLALQSEIPNYKAGTNITIDNSNPNAPVINASGGGFPSLDDVLTVGNTSEKSLKISSSSSRYSLLSPGDLSIYNGSTNARYFATSTVMKSRFGESVLRADYLQVEDANDNIAKLGGNNILFRKDNFSGVNLKAGDVTGSNKTVYLPSENGTLALQSEIPNYQAGTNITIDNSNPNAPVINASGGGGSSSTDLTYTANPTNGLVNSSTGTNAVIPLANATNAGLMPAEFTKEWKETTTAVVYPHKDNVITSPASFTFPELNITTYFRQVGNLVNVYFKLNYVHEKIKTTDEGFWVVEIPVNIPDVSYPFNLPFTISQSGGFHPLANPSDDFYKTNPVTCEALLKPNSNIISLRVKINNELGSSKTFYRAISGVLTYSVD